jgi:hypothetical protein
LGLQLPTWEFTWECEGSLLHTFLHSREYVMWLPASSWPAPLQPLCLVRKPKARVATTLAAWWWINSWRCSSVSRIAFATKASFVVPRSLTQENKNKNYIPMLKCKQCFKKKEKILKYTTHEWFQNRDTWILHPFLWFGCVYWIPMSNSKRPMQVSKALHKQFYLLQLSQQGSHPFQSVPMHFMGWTPPPMLESQWCPTRSRRLNIPTKVV